MAGTFGGRGDALLQKSVGFCRENLCVIIRVGFCELNFAEKTLTDGLQTTNLFPPTLLHIIIALFLVFGLLHICLILRFLSGSGEEEDI